MQSATSHYFGQNFAKAFEIQYRRPEQHPAILRDNFVGDLHPASSARIIMTHGDDQGLVLPPRLAPIQAVIVPIFKNDEEKSKVMEVADRIFKELKAAGIRIKMDDRDNVSSGFKFNDWEMRGVPVRIEIGPKDVEKGSVALARRDKPGQRRQILRPTSGSGLNCQRVAGRDSGFTPQARHRVPRCQHP